MDTIFRRDTVYFPTSRATKAKLGAKLKYVHNAALKPNAKRMIGERTRTTYNCEKHQESLGLLTRRVGHKNEAIIILIISIVIVILTSSSLRSSAFSGVMCISGGFQSASTSDVNFTLRSRAFPAVFSLYKARACRATTVSCTKTKALVKSESQGTRFLVIQDQE